MLTLTLTHARTHTHTFPPAHTHIFPPAANQLPHIQTLYIPLCFQERVKLAWKIEKIEYHNGRQKQQNSWFTQAAAAMEIDLDDDVLTCKSLHTRNTNY